MHQGTLNKTRAPWVGFLEPSDSFERIGEIASAATGNCDFGERLASALEHYDFRAVEFPTENGGAEAPGGSAAYDGDSPHRLRECWCHRPYTSLTLPAVVKALMSLSFMKAIRFANSS